MPADTYDPILGIILQATGNNNNSWGDTFNNSGAKPIARATAGVNTISATGGTFDLSATVPPAGLRQDIDAIQLLTGALVSALTIVVPNVSKIWWFQNDTSGAFNTYLKLPTGTSLNGGLVQIPQGISVMVMCDGAGRLRRLDRNRVGEIIHYAGNGFSNIPESGTLLCNGASLLRADYPDLFNVISTVFGAVDALHFTLPNVTDTGRYLRSIVPTSTGVGTILTNQNQAHVHAVSGAPSVGTLSTDSQGTHSHTATDSGHIHGLDSNVITHAGPPLITVVGSGAFGLGNSGANTTTGSAIITVGSAGAHAHNVTGAPGVGSLATVSQGGTESRPESMCVLMCIKY